MSKCLFPLACLCLAVFSPCAVGQKARRDAGKPTFENVKYGPHDRNVFDLWQAKSDKPTPVLIFYHGGSFRGGDKSSVKNRAILQQCLDAGISVASANYRLSQQAVYPAPMHDGARVVQFLRTKSREYNLDPGKVALSGSSAGATMALWIALHDDLADATSNDPVARMSSRVTTVISYNGPCSMEPPFIEKHFGVTELGAMLKLFGATSRDEMMNEKMKPIVRDASPIQLVSKDDPPLFLHHQADLAKKAEGKEGGLAGWIHHPRFSELLKQEYDRVGLECAFYHGGKPSKEGAEVEFLNKQFSAAK